MRTHRKCGKCGTPVRKETKLDYPFYCPHCDENLYGSETLHKREINREQARNDISKGVVRLYSHNIAWWLDGAGHELSETDEQHICAMLKQNFYAGELCSTTADGGEVYGWWNIKKQ
jgi:formamidopyrimidine-DNA glycosylase